MNPDSLHELPLAPAWSLAVGQAGKICIWAAIAFYVLAILGYALAGKRPALGKLASGAFCLGAVGLMGAFGLLITLFVKNQFHYEYVFARADIHTDLKYKIAGVWSGQQGSFLLWGVAAAIFGLLSLWGTGPYRRAFGGVYSLFLGSIAGILAYETPFNLIKDLVEGTHVHTVATGNGMVPSLQNYWIVIHPPTIFLGFGCLTVLFAYAVAAMIQGDVQGWAQRVRPWSLVGLGILALGICMGGFWAYETLGWGGFWMWDPVENASFVPWLLLAAFVHGIIVQISRSRWHGTNLWFAALPFLAFLYGTFLTRSGSLGDTSVHSFANMDRAALNILKGVMAVFFFGFTGLYFWRGRALAKAADRPIEVVPGQLHREGLYGAGVIFLALFGLVLAIGMSWPMFMAMAGKSVARIEEPAYHKVIFYFFLPIIVLVAVAPFVSWRGMGARALGVRLVNVISIAAGIVGFSLIALRGPRWGIADLGSATVSMPFGFRMSVVPWVAFLLVLCAFAAVANLWRLAETMKRSRSSAGAFLSHFGLATLLAGLIVSRGFEQDEKAWLQASTPLNTEMGYTLQYRELTGSSLYDRDSKLVLDVTGPDGAKFEARPGLYFNRDMNTGKDEPFVWPHIERGLGHDVYIALGRPVMYAWEGDGQWFKPGETQTINNITVKYEKMTTEGTLGTPSAKFNAHLKITTDDKTYTAVPSLSAGGMTPEMPFVGPDLRVAVVGMDAKDKSVRLQMILSSPLFPIHMFTKPLTGLVWGGTGILFLGGLLSAWARRRPRAVGVEEEEPSPTSSPTPATTPTSKDAPVPAT
ncbi:MAG: cytochrome c biogenesis protein CcsA [Fimbriimonas sp.]